MVDTEQTEKEKSKLIKIVNGILFDYPNVNGLESVFNSIFGIFDSEVFKDLIRDMERLERIYNKSDYFLSSIPDEVIHDIPQIKYAFDVLFPSKIYFFIPQRFLSEISILHYSNLAEIIFLIWTFNNKEFNHANIFSLSHKIMMLFYNFDKSIPFNEPNKDYFIKLKNLKWDKEAKNLFKRTIKLFEKVVLFCCEEVVDEDNLMFYPVTTGIFISATRGFVILLSGCSAINNGRDFMVFDDVVCAWKVYFKLLKYLNKHK